MMNGLCQQVRLAAMARADREMAPLAAAEIDAHLAGCAECRSALMEMQATIQLLASCQMRRQNIQLASKVQARIAGAQSSRAQMRYFLVLWMVLLFVLLAGQAIVSQARPPIRWTTRAAVCLLVVGWFAWQRENPFSINEDLKLNERIA